MNDEQIEAAVRKVEANEWDTINRYLLRNKWSDLTQQMKATRAGGVLWLELEKTRAAVLTEYAQYFDGDERKAVFDLVKDIK